MRMRRLWSLLLAFALCASMWSIGGLTAAADSSDFVIDTSGVLTSYNGSGGDVVIPDGVKAIGEQAFLQCKGLTSVTIPRGVTSIEDRAFEECSGLTSVALPDSLTSIGDDAFSGCMDLTSVTIPNGVTSIGEQAFFISRLTSVELPASVTSIGQQAFDACYSLASITVDSDNMAFSSEDGVLFDKAKATLLQYPGLKPEPRISFRLPSLASGPSRLRVRA